MELSLDIFWKFFHYFIYPPGQHMLCLFSEEMGAGGFRAESETALTGLQVSQEAAMMNL